MRVGNSLLVFSLSLQSLVFAASTSAQAADCECWNGQLLIERRERHWSLLGDLPRQHHSAPPRILKTERVGDGDHGFTIEHLLLDLNGLEAVPAILVIPDRRQPKAPAMLYMHWQINELIVPRSRLSVNGRNDPLTPASGVEKVRDYLLPRYAKCGHPDECQIELFNCAHQETPEMRRLVEEWLDTKFVGQ